MVRFRRYAAAAAAAVIVVLPLATAQAQEKLSGAFSIATLPPGTTFNATAAGIAKLFNENTGARMRLREASATLEVYIARGETHFALNASPSAFDAWTGSGIYKGRKFRNIRTVMVGPVLHGSMMVTRDSGMKLVADLKGKRVPARFAAMPTFLDDIDVLFAGGGISWNDIKPVTVAGIRENYQAFMDGPVRCGQRLRRIGCRQPGRCETPWRAFSLAARTPQSCRDPGESQTRLLSGETAERVLRRHRRRHDRLG